MKYHKQQQARRIAAIFVVGWILTEASAYDTAKDILEIARQLLHDYTNIYGNCDDVEVDANGSAFLAGLEGFDLYSLPDFFRGLPLDDTN